MAAGLGLTTAMAEKHAPRGLELQQDLDIEAIQWRAARITWAILLLIMAAALAGLFGDGPLGRAHVPSPQAPFSVEYGRFGRFGSAMRIAVHAPAGPDGGVTFAMNGALLRAYRIDAITPRPSAERLVADGVEYRFASAPANGAPVIFDVQPTERWLVHGEVRGPGVTLAFWQFIYP